MKTFIYKLIDSCKHNDNFKYLGIPTYVESYELTDFEAMIAIHESCYKRGTKRKRELEGSTPCEETDNKRFHLL